MNENNNDKTLPRLVNKTVYIEELLSQRFNMLLPEDSDPVQAGITRYENGTFVLEPGNGAEVIQRQIVVEHADGTIGDLIQFWPGDCDADRDCLEPTEYTLSLVRRAAWMLLARYEAHKNLHDSAAQTYYSAYSILHAALANDVEMLNQFDYFERQHTDGEGDDQD